MLEAKLAKPLTYWNVFLFNIFMPVGCSSSWEQFVLYFVRKTCLGFGMKVVLSWVHVKVATAYGCCLATLVAQKRNPALYVRCVNDRSKYFSCSVMSVT